MQHNTFSYSKWKPDISLLYIIKYTERVKMGSWSEFVS